MSSFPAISETQRKAPQTGASLLTVAPVVEVAADATIGSPTAVLGSAGEHWTQGFSWLPEGFDVSGSAGFGEQLSTPDGSLDVAVTQEFVPFTVWARDTAATVNQQRDRWGRARRALLADQSFWIAAELERGAFAQAPAPDLPNRYLNKSADLVVLHSGDTIDLSEALVCLDGAITRHLRNRQGMMHMTPEALTAAQQLLWPRWSGSTPYTPNGHVIAADAGYTGLSTGAGSMMFGTDMIRILLGPVSTTPTAEGDLRAANIDPNTNDLIVRAKRTAAYQWDGGCHLGIHTDVNPCNPALAED